MALLTDMGVKGNDNEILQPMLKNRFKIRFFGLGGNDEYLTLQVISIDRPKLGFAEIVLDRYNSRAYIPGKHEFQTINAVFESDIAGRVSDAIRDQLEMQQRLIAPTRANLMPASRSGGRLKFQMNIDQLDGDTDKLEVWGLHGCYLSNVDWGDLDYSASETVKITLTIRFDHATQTIVRSRDESAVNGLRIPIFNI